MTNPIAQKPLITKRGSASRHKSVNEVMKRVKEVVWPSGRGDGIVVRQYARSYVIATATIADRRRLIHRVALCKHGEWQRT